MFYAKPATAGAEVFDRLYLFMKTGATPFDIRRLEHDAQKLEHADLAQAYTVRAAIAALQWNIDDARYWTEKACIASASVTVRRNASVTFRHLNQCGTSGEYAVQALKLSPLNREDVEQAVGMLACAGRLSEALEIDREYRQRVPAEPPLRLDTEQLTGILDELKLPERQLQLELQAAMDVLTKERMRHKGVVFESSTEPDGGAMFTARVQFCGDIDTEMKLESRLAHLLADMSSWDPSRLSVEFEYVAEDVNAGEPARVA
jgi:hypothetical protein